VSDRPIFIGDADPPQQGAAQDGEALKLRGADALEGALAFVDAEGDALSRLRARVALRAAAADELGDRIEWARVDDGAFEEFSPAAAGWLGRLLHAVRVERRLRGSLEALMLLGDGGQLHRGCAERAVRFVEGRQHEDGSFGPLSGDLGPRLAVTGIAAGLLARSLVARPAHLEAAGDFLGSAWSPERIEAGRWPELVGYSMFHTNAPDELSDETLQWCGRELERGFRSHRTEALGVLQVLLACHVGSLPGASFAPEELLERLLGEQAADGGFDALCPDGPAFRVGPTIDAMRGVIGLCATF